MIHVNPNSKQIKYALLLIIPFLVLSFLVLLSKKLNKDISASTYTDITTQITVGNSAPSFTSGPAENTASTSTAPTSIGATVQFNATATDANGESYYLIVCSTNSVTAGSVGASPTCVGFTTQSLIDYGSLSAGGSNDPLNKTTVITPTGNAPFNVNISGTKLCTDYSTCSTSGKTPIDIAQQKYSLATGTAYASGTALSATPTEALIGVPKIKNGTVTTKTIWWGVSIPIGTVSGIYNGLNTITVIGEGVTSGGTCEKC